MNHSNFDPNDYEKGKKLLSHYGEALDLIINEHSWNIIDETKDLIIKD